MHGFARTEKTAQEVIDSRRLVAKDKWEGMELFPIDFNLKEVITFVQSHNPWTPHGLACTYYTLVHEFKRSPVNKAIRRYMY